MPMSLAIQQQSQAVLTGSISNWGVLTGNISFSWSGGPKRDIYTVVNVRTGAPMDIGQFEESQGVAIVRKPQFFGGETNIKDNIASHLKVGIVEDSPFVTYRYRQDGQKSCQLANKLKCYEGLSIDIIEKLAEKFSFSYEFVEEPNGKFGSPVEGTDEAEWDGLIGMLIRKEIDIGIVAFGINTAREQVVDFTVPLLTGNW
eukprot:sb/3470666/